jgi:hypothetical protein
MLFFHCGDLRHDICPMLWYSWIYIPLVSIAFPPAILQILHRMKSVPAYRNEK